jgi:hypothetical protein
MVWLAGQLSNRLAGYRIQALAGVDAGVRSRRFGNSQESVTGRDGEVPVEDIAGIIGAFGSPNRVTVGREMRCALRALFGLEPEVKAILAVSSAVALRVEPHPSPRLRSRPPAPPLAGFRDLSRGISDYVLAERPASPADDGPITSQGDNHTEVLSVSYPFAHLSRTLQDH